MASMRKLKGKYYIRIRYQGREKLVPTYTSIKRDADIILKKYKLNEQEVKLNLSEHLLDNNLTIEDCIKYFKKNYQTEKGITDSTLSSYNKSLNDFQGCFSYIRRFNELTRNNYAELVNYLKNKYCSTTINIRLRSIRTFLNYLYENEKIKKIPFKVKQVKIDSAPPKYLLPEEIEKIYSLVEDDKLRATFKTFEITGMRIGELKNSYRDGNFIKITKTKTRKERIIPIADEYIEYYDLARYEKPYSKDWISRCFTKYSRLVCRTRKTIHSLRHTYAYVTLLKTNSITIVRDLLGHSNLSTTEVYANIPQEYLKQIFNETVIKKPEVNSIQARA